MRTFQITNPSKKEWGVVKISNGILMSYPHIVRLIIAFASCLFFWLLSRSEHNNARFQQTGTFQAPMLIGVIFGIYRSPTLLNARGIAGQLFSFLLFVTLTGNILGFIKPDEMKIYYVLVVLLVIILLGLVYVISKIFSRQ